MKREDLVKEVRQLLTRTGFYSPDPKLFQDQVFDTIARRDASLVVVKCLLNGNSLTKESADALLQIAFLLRGSPLVVAEHGARGELEPGVIYLRHRAPLLSLGTLRDFLVEGVPPIAFSGPGGHFVSMDAVALKRARQARALSLDALAREVGLSRRSIQLYEEGMGAAVEAAERLERFFGESITVPLDPFSYRVTPEVLAAADDDPSGFEAHVFRTLEGMGYRVVQAARCPFDAIAEAPAARILSGIETASGSLAVRARSLTAISRVAETDAVLFVSRDSSRSSIEGTPVVTRKELDSLDTGDKIMDLIKRRKAED
jgi:putative transcriptional regulator